MPVLGTVNAKICPRSMRMLLRIAGWILRRRLSTRLMLGGRLLDCSTDAKMEMGRMLVMETAMGQQRLLLRTELLRLVTRQALPVTVQLPPLYQDILSPRPNPPTLLDTLFPLLEPQQHRDTPPHLLCPPSPQDTPSLLVGPQHLPPAHPYPSTSHPALPHQTNPHTAPPNPHTPPDPDPAATTQQHPHTQPMHLPLIQPKHPGSLLPKRNARGSQSRRTR